MGSCFANLTNVWDVMPEKRRRFAHNFLTFLTVLPHNDVSQGEVGSGSVREVTDYEAVRHTAMLVNHKEVSHCICSKEVAFKAHIRWLTVTLNYLQASISCLNS